MLLASQRPEAALGPACSPSEVPEHPDLVSLCDDGIPVADDLLMHLVDADPAGRVLLENARVVEVQITREPVHSGGDRSREEVYSPVPSAERENLWHRLLPEELPRDADVDPAALVGFAQPIRFEGPTDTVDAAWMDRESPSVRLLQPLRVSVACRGVTSEAVFRPPLLRGGALGWG